jgi:hypothetical protein
MSSGTPAGSLGTLLLRYVLLGASVRLREVVHGEHRVVTLLVGLAGLAYGGRRRVGAARRPANVLLITVGSFGPIIRA